MHTGFGIMVVGGEEKFNFAESETHFSIPEIGYAPDRGKREERGLINYGRN
jgi:hypothetical protein